MSLQPHQQRVMDEATALRDRLAKLAMFLVRLANGALPPIDAAEHMRLQRQCAAMTTYLDVLTERIEAFKGTACLG
jgi:hypothetical protein